MSRPSRLARWVGSLAILSAVAYLIVFLVTPEQFVRTSELYPLGRGQRTGLQAKLRAGRPAAFPIEIDHISPLGRLERLEMAVATSEPARVERGWIEFEGCPDRLEAEPGQSLGDGELLRLVPTKAGCGRHARDRVRKAVLRIVLDRDAELSLLAGFDEEPLGRVRFVRPGAARELFSTGFWIWRPEPDTGTRLELLAWMWDLGDGLWILAVLIGAALLAVIGWWLLPRRPTWAMLFLTIGVTCPQAVIVPPFQAPDEPDHLLAYSRISGNWDLAIDARSLARRGHLERIKYRPRETFTPPNMAKAYETAWGDHVRPSRMASRSPWTVAIWKTIGLVPARRAATALIRLRLLNALGFALAVALGTALIGWRSRRPLLPVFVFCVPALPFFAVHVSNNAYLVHLATLAGCLAIASFGRRRDHAWRGLWLGALLTVLTLSSLPALVMAAWVVAAVLDRWLTAVRLRGSLRARVDSAYHFWGGLLLGVAPLVVGWGIWDVFQKVRDQLRGVWPAVSELSTGSLTAMVILLMAAGFTFELVMTTAVARLRFRVGWRRISASAPIAAAALTAIALAVFLLVSPFLGKPGLSRLAHERLPLGAYSWRATEAVLSGLSFRQPDLFLSQGYWTGFGWMDAQPPAIWVRLLAGTAGIGLVLLLAWTVKNRQPRAAARALLWMLAAAAVAALTGFAAHLYQIGIAGRYLVPFYAVVLSAAFSGWALWLSPSGPRNRWQTSGSLLGMLAIVALHAYSLGFLLTRYFG
ncbi:MAG: hypothetical protein RL885_08390 [Planctomycetota bacterium]